MAVSCCLLILIGLFFAREINGSEYCRDSDNCDLLNGNPALCDSTDADFRSVCCDCGGGGICRDLYTHQTLDYCDLFNGNPAECVSTNDADVSSVCCACGGGFEIDCDDPQSRIAVLDFTTDLYIAAGSEGTQFDFTTEKGEQCRPFYLALESRKEIFDECGNSPPGQDSCDCTYAHDLLHSLFEFSENCKGATIPDGRRNLLDPDMDFRTDIIEPACRGEDDKLSICCACSFLTILDSGVLECGMNIDQSADEIVNVLDVIALIEYILGPNNN